jgi:hypothetical protein
VDPGVSEQLVIQPLTPADRAARHPGGHRPGATGRRTEPAQHLLDWGTILSRDVSGHRYALPRVAKYGQSRREFPESKDTVGQQDKVVQAVAGFDGSDHGVSSSRRAETLRRRMTNSPLASWRNGKRTSVRSCPST